MRALTFSFLDLVINDKIEKEIFQYRNYLLIFGMIIMTHLKSLEHRFSDVEI